MLPIILIRFEFCGFILASMGTPSVSFEPIRLALVILTF